MANSCLAGRFCYPMAGGRIGGKKKATLLVTSSGNKSKRENIHRATVSTSESLSVIIQCLQFTFRDTGKHP